MVPNAIFVGSDGDDSFRPVVKIDALPPPTDVAVAVDWDVDDIDAEDCIGGGCCSSGRNVNFLVCSNCICVTKIL